MYKFFLKRFFDIFLSSFLLISLFPFVGLIAIIISIELKGTPFFFQKRAGLNGRPFHVIKFRTMSNEVDSSGELLPDNDRLTNLGRLIRRLSIDELPQLANVLFGQMSFIGPRPFLYEYMDYYSKEEKRRHNVRPGITGWAQINGRNSLTWKEKFRLDLFYVDNFSLRLDIKILFNTVVKVLKKEDVDQGVEVTMEKYNGEN